MLGVTPNIRHQKVKTIPNLKKMDRAHPLIQTFFGKMKMNSNRDNLNKNPISNRKWYHKQRHLLHTRARTRTRSRTHTHRHTNTTLHSNYEINVSHLILTATSAVATGDTPLLALHWYVPASAVLIFRSLYLRPLAPKSSLEKQKLYIILRTIPNHSKRSISGIN